MENSSSHLICSDLPVLNTSPRYTRSPKADSCQPNCLATAFYKVSVTTIHFHFSFLHSLTSFLSQSGSHSLPEGLCHKVWGHTDQLAHLDGPYLHRHLSPRDHRTHWIQSLHSQGPCGVSSMVKVIGEKVLMKHEQLITQGRKRSGALEATCMVLDGDFGLSRHRLSIGARLCTNCQLFHSLLAPHPQGIWYSVAMP